MRIVEFHRGHLELLEVQGAQINVRPMLTDPDYARALESGPAYTALDDIKVVGCAGLLVQWKGRALAWAILSKDVGPYLTWLTRIIRGVLAESQFRRIESVGACDWPEQARWHRLLGFEREAERMRGYSPDGSDFELWARVK